MIARCFIALVVAAGVLLPAAVASAHARFLGSDPEPAAKLDAAPTSLQISYSEPPVSARQVTVEDGCGNDVVTGAEVEDKAIVADLAEGQPGKWRVASRVISAVDGHPTEKTFSFSVAGKADCSDTGSGPAPREESESGSPLPIVLAVVGATALVAAGALVVRKRS